jgi:hypothetical protein
MFATPEKGDNLSPFSGRQGFATVSNVRECRPSTENAVKFTAFATVANVRE